MNPLHLLISIQLVLITVMQYLFHTPPYANTCDIDYIFLSKLGFVPIEQKALSSWRRRQIRQSAAISLLSIGAKLHFHAHGIFKINRISTIAGSIGMAIFIQYLNTSGF